MKKSVILTILGLGIATVASYGQGSMAFNTYSAKGGSGILTTYGNGPLIGTALPSSFIGELLFSTTQITDSATTAATANDPLTAGWTVASSANFATPGNISPGYVSGPNFNYTGTAGAGPFWFEVVAYDGASYGAGTYAGHSASFQATLVTGTTLPNADQIDNLTPFSVYQVSVIPEPTTMALGGLGLAALMLVRRKKA